MLDIINAQLVLDKKIIFENIHFSSGPGKLHLILGSNGAGKSSLIKCISSQIKLTGGEILFENNSIHSFSLEEQSRFRAVLSQENEISFPLTVSEIVMMGRSPYFEWSPSLFDFQVVNETMEMLGIQSFADRNYFTLSGGEKQRVHFARVLAQILDIENKQSKLLLLDEPLTYLDILYQHNFMKIVKKLLVGIENLHIVGVLHDLNLSSKYADELTLLRNGKLIASGLKRDVLTHENLMATYDMPPKIINIEEEVFITF